MERPSLSLCTGFTDFWKWFSFFGPPSIYKARNVVFDPMMTKLSEKTL